MKIATLLLLLMFVQTHATGQEVDDFVGPPAPYPEAAPRDRFPLSHWQLTMIRQDQMIDIDSPGSEFLTRTQCIMDGTRRILEEEQADLSWLPDEVKWLGFVCEYVER